MPVISLCGSTVETRWQDISHLHLRIEDGKPVPIEQFVRILDVPIENVRWIVVQIQCSAGISRAPSMAAASMELRATSDDAIREIAALRTHVRSGTQEPEEHLR